MDVFRCREKRSCTDNTYPKFTQSLTLPIHAGKTPVPKRVPSSSISGSPSKGKNKSTMLSVPIFSFWKLPSYMKTASHCHCYMGPVKRLCPRQDTTSCSQRSPSLKSQSFAITVWGWKEVPPACSVQCSHCLWSSLAAFTRIMQNIMAILMKVAASAFSSTLLYQGSKICMGCSYSAPFCPYFSHFTPSAP